MERERERPISEAEAKRQLSQMFGEVMKTNDSARIVQTPRTVVRKIERAEDNAHLTIGHKKFKVDPDLLEELNKRTWWLTDNAVKRPISVDGVRLEQIILQAKKLWEQPGDGHIAVFRFVNKDSLDLRAENIKMYTRKARTDIPEPEQPKALDPVKRQAVEAAKVALTEFPLTLRVTGRFVADSVEVVSEQS